MYQPTIHPNKCHHFSTNIFLSHALDHLIVGLGRFSRILLLMRLRLRIGWILPGCFGLIGIRFILCWTGSNPNLSRCIRAGMIRLCSFFTIKGGLILFYCSFLILTIDLHIKHPLYQLSIGINQLAQSLTNKIK